MTLACCNDGSLSICTQFMSGHKSDGRISKITAPITDHDCDGTRKVMTLRTVWFVDKSMAEDYNELSAIEAKHWMFKFYWPEHAQGVEKILFLARHLPARARAALTRVPTFSTDKLRQCEYPNCTMTNANIFNRLYIHAPRYNGKMWFLFLLHFDGQALNTQNNWGENDICKRLGFVVFSDKDDKP